MVCANCGKEMQETEASCPNCGSPVKSTERKKDPDRLDFRLVGKLCFLLVLLGFCLPITRMLEVDMNGFSLAKHLFSEADYSIKFSGLLAYLLFAFSLAGIGVGVLLLMKRDVPIVVDWIVLLGVSQGFSGFFPIPSGPYDFSTGSIYRIVPLQFGYYLAAVGSLAAVAAQLAHSFLRLREKRNKPGYPTEYSPKNSLKTLLFCYFLGGLGLHRFYVGRHKTGAAMLALLILTSILIAASIFTYSQYGLLRIASFLPWLGWAVYWVSDLVGIHNGTFIDKKGQPLRYPKEPEFPPGYRPKSKVTALLLCIFLGWLAIHRFYLGKINAGLALLFTGPLMFFLVMIIGIPLYVGMMAVRSADETVMAEAMMASLPVFIAVFIAIVLVFIVLWAIRWQIDLINICSNECRDERGYLLGKGRDLKNALRQGEPEAGQTPAL